MPELSEMIQEFLEGSIKSIGGKQPVIQSKTITENGTYNTPSGVDGFNPVVVNVPSQEPNIQPKSIFENGTYNVPSGVDGFNPVVVDVPMKEEITLNATTNGTYTPREGRVYNNVIVNVPLPQNAYLLKSVANLPQAIASFNDGEEMVMPSLKVAIEPQQDLHGYDAPWGGGAGKNKFDQDTAYASYKQSDGGFRITGNVVTLIKNYIPQSLVGQQVTVSVYFDLTKEASPNGVRIACNIGGTETESSRVEANQKKTVSLTFTPTASTDYWYITYGNTGANYFYFIECQLEIGSTATTFAPYSNICPISGWDKVDVTVADDAETPTISNVYTIDLDGTRYGGEVDVINGIVTPAPYYASYNGETLTGEWISDRDKYEVGATPTIGAQVVNIGASGTPVSILPTTVMSLRGVNNVYANTGDITDAEYFSREE